MVYKILTVEQWPLSADRDFPTPIDIRDGFIHLRWALSEKKM
jgi:uncharacterized protein (DUF952 family)